MQLDNPQQSARRSIQQFRAVALAAVVCLIPGVALAGDFAEQTCGFLENITGLLNIASIAVVTIAVIFAGYQIAFAHKRISDVLPILIGGVLIGAAGQLAAWIMPERTAGECGDIAMTFAQQLQYLV